MRAKFTIEELPIIQETRNMSAETLSMIAGVILSLTFSYVPGLSSMFASLSPEYKRLIILGLLVLISLGILGIACAGTIEVFNLTITCDEAGIIDLVEVLMVAIIANQGVYAISPRTKSIRNCGNED
jgi:hypothetical protein